MEFFAYWNGEQIRSLFEILSLMTGGGDFLSLLRLAALLGFLCVLTVSALHYRGVDAMSFVFAVMLFYCAMLVPKMDVTIRDDRAGTVSVVQNVPIGIGVLACGTSHIGHWLTQTFESHFSRVDAQRLSRFGAVFPERAVTLVQTVGPVTPQGRRLVDDFNRYCVVPELIDDAGKLTAISQSADVWATISAPGWINPARRTVSVDGTWIGCDAAIADIDQYLNAVEIPELEKHLAMHLLPDRADAAAAVRQALPQSEALLLGISRTLSQSVRHTLMANTLTQGVQSVAAAAKHPLALSTALSHAQGNLAGEINYRTMAKIAQEALPKVRNSLEFVILGSFPLLFVMIIASGHRAGMILRSYITLLLWLQLWAPISAVINYLIIEVDANPLSRIIAEYGGDTMLAADLIREYGTSSQAIAGYLLMLAPVIAFAVAKGSDIATAQMVGSVMAPAQSAAQSQGAALASGNVTLGNAGFNNVNTNNQTGNTHQRFANFADPNQVQTSNAYGSALRTQDGLVTGAAASRVDLGVTPSVNVGQTDSAGATSLTQTQTGYQQSDSLSSSQAARQNLQLSAGFAAQLNQTLARGSSLTQSDQSALSQSSSHSRQTGVRATRDFANAQTGEITSRAGLGLGMQSPTQSPANAGLGGNALTPIDGNVSAQTGSSALTGTATSPTMPMADSQTQSSTFQPTPAQKLSQAGAQLGSSLAVNHAQRLIDTATSSDATVDEATRKSAYTQLMSAARTLQAQTSDIGTKSAAQRFTGDLTRAYEAAHQTALNRSSMARAQNQSGYVSNQDIRTMMNNNPQALESAIDTFGSIERAQSVLFHSAAARRGFAMKLQSGQTSQTGALHPTPMTQSAVDALGARQAARFNREMNASIVRSSRTTRQRARSSQEALSLTPGTLPNRAGVDSDTLAVRDGVATRLTRDHAQMTIERGAQIAADALYRDDQSGIGTTVSNALAGGLTYRSPQAYSKRLLQKAQSDPALAKTLAEVGEKAAPTDRVALERRYQEHLNELKK